MTEGLLDQEKSIGLTIWTLAWPAILEQILQVSVTYVDSAMVGSLGAAATAAVSVPTSTIWLVNGWMNAFAIGYAVLMARNIGGRRFERAKMITRQALVTALIFGAILSTVFTLIAQVLPKWIGAEEHVQTLARGYYTVIALAYLPNLLMIMISSLMRLSGDTRTPLLLNTLNNVLNIILNIFFIFGEVDLGPITIHGLGMGVKGAAIATSLAVTITAILLFIIWLTRPSIIQLELNQSFTLNREIQKNAFRLGLPVGLERSTLSFGQIVLTKIVGSLGTTALAAHFLANTAEAMTYLPASGVSTAATTLVAQSLGRGDKALAKRFGNATTLIGTLLMTTMGVVLYVTAPSLMGFFTRDQNVIALGTTILRIEAFVEPAFGLSMLVFGVFRGSGDTRRPFYISIAGMWVVRLPLALFMVRCTSLG
ncbi:MAG: MATE family efflux transporter, partial [Spirochaetota bacterium]|nr:MATE family efflux transporter [Spirochaetota bacterium]